MAKITRSQANYIETKFANICDDETEKVRTAAYKQYEGRKKELISKFKKIYPKWSNHPSVILAMANTELKQNEWDYAQEKVRAFDAAAREAKNLLHETLLFSDGSLEEAQTILNQFINKLKENQ